MSSGPSPVFFHLRAPNGLLPARHGYLRRHICRWALLRSQRATMATTVLVGNDAPGATGYCGWLGPAFYVLPEHLAAAGSHRRAGRCGRSMVSLPTFPRDIRSVWPTGNHAIGARPVSHVAWLTAPLNPQDFCRQNDIRLHFQQGCVQDFRQQSELANMARDTPPRSGLTETRYFQPGSTSLNFTGRFSRYDFIAAYPMTTGTRPSRPVTGVGLSSVMAATKSLISAT